MTPRPTERSRARRVFGARSCDRAHLDEVLQHIVEHAQHVFDEARSSLHSSQVSKFSETRQQTAVRSSPRWSMPVGSMISLHRLEARP